MIRPDGTYRLNSGGWRSVTTKDRINRFSPCRLGQTNGMWYVGDTLYKDGMLIDSGGNPIGKPTHAITDVLKLKRRVDRLFTKFFKIIADSAKHKDIGDWQSYSKKSTPHVNSKSHLTKLWDTVLIETSKSGEWASGPHHLFVWIYLSNAGQYYQFRLIRRNCVEGRDNSNLLRSLRTFMRQRKQHITEMIISGELSDGTVRVS